MILYILLCGYPPFNGSNDKAIFARVLEGKFTFVDNDWSCISGSVKDLIVSMLEYDPSKRISAEAALRHDWFTLNINTNEKVNSTRVLQNLKNFRVLDCLRRGRL